MNAAPSEIATQGKMQKKWAQYIREVLRLLDRRAGPSVRSSRPNAIPGNLSDSRATMNEAMPDPRPARNQGFAVKHPRWEPHVRIYIIALVPVTIWNIIPT